MNIRSKLFYAYILLSVAYVATFLLPRQIGTLPQLTDLQYRLLSLTVLVPQLLIWFAAFYGYAKLRRYATMISGSPDGKEVAKITKGLLILAFSLPISTVSGAVVGAISHHISHVNGLFIARTYISLLLPLLAFIYISHGAHGLGRLTKQYPRLRTIHILTVAFAATAALYCFVTFTSGRLEAYYHLPGWLIALTVTGPYLYTWYIGLQAAYEMHIYSQHAPGSIYRRTWNILAGGIASIIVVQILFQYLSTVSAQIQRLQLVRLLILIYVLLAALSIGYLLVALGAKKLQRIEEV